MKVFIRSKDSQPYLYRPAMTTTICRLTTASVGSGKRSQSGWSRTECMPSIVVGCLVVCTTCDLEIQNICFILSIPLLAQHGERVVYDLCQWCPRERVICLDHTAAGLLEAVSIWMSEQFNLSEQPPRIRRFRSGCRLTDWFPTGCRLSAVCLEIQINHTVNAHFSCMFVEDMFHSYLGFMHYC